MPTMSLTLATVKEETTGSGITVSNFDSLEAIDTASSGRLRYPSISVGRPSTSTIRTSSSMSTSSSAEAKRHMESSSPRRPASIFSRLRGLGGGASSDESRDFYEKRSLTPHELLAPLSRQDPSERPLPPLPVDEHGLFIVDSRPASILASMPQEPGKPVFGVDLNESIRLAPMRIRISHRGSSTSHRSFPLSVYKCCEFIKRSGKFFRACIFCNS